MLPLSPTELSLLFYTADQSALRRVAKLLGVHGTVRRGESLGGMVVAKKGGIHLDFDVERHREGLEWTVYVHENPSARVPRTVMNLSRRVGYLEGFGAWLEDRLGAPSEIEVTCTAEFELSSRNFRPKWPLPSKARSEIARLTGANGTLYLLGLETETARLWCDSKPGSKTFSAGVTFMMEKTPAAGLIAVALRESTKLVTDSLVEQRK